MADGATTADFQVDAEWRGFHRKLAMSVWDRLTIIERRALWALLGTDGEADCARLLVQQYSPDVGPEGAQFTAGYLATLALCAKHEREL